MDGALKNSHAYGGAADASVAPAEKERERERERGGEREGEARIFPPRF